MLPLMTYPSATSVILQEYQDGFPGYSVEWLRPLYAIMSITMMMNSVISQINLFLFSSHKIIHFDSMKDMKVTDKFESLYFYLDENFTSVAFNGFGEDQNI